jgi:hypothetical protein
MCLRWKNDAQIRIKYNYTEPSVMETGNPKLLPLATSALNSNYMAILFMRVPHQASAWTTHTALETEKLVRKASWDHQSQRPRLCP